jgi:uncharacterized protein (DUF488 family)
LLYSVGYQGMKDPQELVDILKEHDIKILVDVRSRPYSRKAKFNKNNLNRICDLEGIRYVWKGDVLGGFSEIHDEAIKALAEWQGDNVACLMCMEKDPDQCHRKYEIGRRLAEFGVEVNHLPLQAQVESSQQAMF